MSKTINTSMEFKEYLLTEASEEDRDVRATIKKLPRSHQKLMHGYKIEFVNGNTLKDGESVGLNNMENKIVLAASWRYSREWTLLHEIGHLVWKKYIANDKELQNQWKAVARNTSEKIKQNSEEAFCHSYAQHYCQKKLVQMQDKNAARFIEKLN